MENARTIPTIGALAILAVAVCLIPAGAHLFEMRNKMALSPDSYMTVQAIYAGWALFGIAILAAIVLTLWHTVLIWRLPRGRWLSLVAFLLIASTQAIFWTFTYPMNVLTENWTVMPPDLEAARQQWEYSHAASAVLTALALLAIVVGVIAAARESGALAARLPDAPIPPRP